MVLVIGGKEYTIYNDEWMYPPKEVNMAQGGTSQSVELGPLGPQLVQLSSSPSDSLMQVEGSHHSHVEAARKL